LKAFEIIELELENIKTYTYEKINFTQGNNVFIGENGAGKSTILESIYLAIFGDTVSGREYADMVRYGEKQGKVVIRFSVNNLVYRIENVVTKKDDTRATQAQKLINQDSGEIIAEGRNAVRIKIEELLEIDAITFISAIYASQGEIDKIITAKDKERKVLFDRLFQIERFEKAWENLLNVQKIINQELKLTENSITSLKKDIEKLPEKQQELKKRSLELEKGKQELSKMKKSYKEINQKFLTIEPLIDEYTKAIAEKELLEEQEQKLDHTIKSQFKIIESLIGEEIKCSLTSIRKQKEKTKPQIDNILNEIAQLRDNEQKIALELANISNQEQKATQLEELINEEKANLDEQINDFIIEISELSKNLENWSEKIPDIENKTQLKLENFRKQLAKFEKIENDIIKKDAELKAKISSVNQCDGKIVQKRLILSRNAGENWRERIEELSKIDFETELQNLTTKISEVEQKHTEFSKEKSVADDGLKRIQDSLQYLSNLKGKEKCPTCKQTLSKETLETLTTSLETEKEKHQTKKKELVKKLKEISEIVKESKQEEKELRLKYQLYNQIEPHYTDLVELESEMQILENEKEKMENKLQKLKDKFNQSKLEQIKEKIEDNEIKIKSIQIAKKKHPQLLKTKENITSNREKLKQVKGKISKLKTKYDNNALKEIDKQIEEKEKEHDKQMSLFEKINSLFNDLEQKKENKTKYKTILKEIKEIEINEGFSEKDKIKKQREDLRLLVSTIDSNMSLLATKVIPPLEEFVNHLIKKERELKEAEKKHEQETKKKIITSILRELMRELPNQLLPNFITRINETATDILQSIIPGSDIQGILLNDDYSLSILRLGNQENITVLSGGETIIVALALRLAFAKEFSALDLLILDEPTIYLDERRRGELVSVLERNRLVRQMFVVTHDPDFERISDKTHFVTKLAGETRVTTTEGEELLEDTYIDMEL
jgi:exonuclease SbcC